MNGFAVHGSSRFSQGFAHGWVSMDSLVNFIDRSFQFHPQSVFGDQFGGVGSNDMSTQDFPVFLAHDNFYKSFWVVDRHRLAGCSKRKFADLVSNSLFLGLFLGHPYTGHLWLAIGTTGESTHWNGIGMTKHPVDRLHCPIGGHMSQPGWSNDISGRIDAWERGLIGLIHLNISTA